jgi:hypothetical protein
MKRTGFIRRRTRLKNASDKRRKRNAEVRDFRMELVQQVGKCDLCCKASDTLCCHEIPRGSRAMAYSEACAILILCNGCHEFIHANGDLWPKLRQAALLKIRRPGAWNLNKLNSLLIAKLDADDVDFAVEKLLRRK